MRRRKYNNVPTVLDGHRFDSKREANHYSELKLLEMAGKISDLTLQPAFPLKVAGSLICTYKADFEYLERDASGQLARVVVDVKSPATKTPTYRLKKKLMLAIHGIEIREV